MFIDDVFWLTGRPGPIVMGRSHKGDCSVGDVLDLVDEMGNRTPVTLRGVELVCRVGQAPTDVAPLNLLLGDGLGEHDVRPGLIIEHRE